MIHDHHALLVTQTVQPVNTQALALAVQGGPSCRALSCGGMSATRRGRAPSPSWARAWSL